MIQFESLPANETPASKKAASDLRVSRFAQSENTRLDGGSVLTSGEWIPAKKPASSSHSQRSSFCESQTTRQDAKPQPRWQSIGEHQLSKGLHAEAPPGGVVRILKIWVSGSGTASATASGRLPESVRPIRPFPLAQQAGGGTSTRRCLRSNQRFGTITNCSRMPNHEDRPR